MCQLFEFHAFFEATCFFPKQTFPSWKVSAFEKCVLKNTFNSSKSLYHVSSIVI